MSEYSQTYGSFTRTGNYPLEANYIFETELELIDFYTNSIEETHLHLGLFKIVGEGSNQALYWVVKEEENLVFKKLLEGVDRDNILSDLINLQKLLLDEIAERENLISEVWGDEKTNILTGLNSIKKISDALNILIKLLNKLHDEFNAVVGTSDKDIIEYLKTLPYQSLTKIALVLDTFLNGTNTDTNTIDTLPELQRFLEGINDSDILLNLFEELWDRIQGSPTPSLQYRTLRGIEDKLVSIDVTSSSQHANLQEELNTTQSGVGLNQDGSYSPDATSYYLKTSTSITNALHILDNLIYTAILEYNLETSDTGNVLLEAEKTSKGYKLTGSIKLNPDVTNQLRADNNGLYYSIDIEYELGTMTVKANGQVIKQFNIGAKNIVSDAFYDTSTESIVIYFKLTDGSVEPVRIPVGNLIREWEVDNIHPTKVVELTKEESFGDGPDKLSADVRISSKPDNMLEKDNNTLYVSKNKALSEINLQLSNLLTAYNNVSWSLQEEIVRSKTEEEMLAGLIQAETSRAMAEIAVVRGTVTDMVTTVSNMKAVLDNLVERVIALETKTSW